MSGKFSTYLSNAILDHVFKTTEFSVPDGIYVALYSIEPTVSGGGTELDGNGYSRIQCSSWDAASSGSIANTNQVVFPTATGEWENITAFGLFDAETGGNFLGFGLIDPGRKLYTNDVIQFASGTIEVELS